MSQINRISRYVERLLRQRRPRKFVPTDDEAAAMQAAIALRSSRAESSIPRAEFVAELRARLAEQAGRTGEIEPEPASAGNRRHLLIGASAAAASAAVAVVIDRTVAGPTGPPPLTTLSPNDGVWHSILTSDELPEGGAQPFDTGIVSGFVSRTGGVVSARSGICTHQLCRLKLNVPERRLDCPCHRTFFALDGTVIRSQLPTQPARLPEITVREVDGHIAVFVPRGS
jgi:nitrite reductase/ring-hydroxylating ferredoxin subunit